MRITRVCLVIKTETKIIVLNVAKILEYDIVQHI